MDNRLILPYMESTKNMLMDMTGIAVTSMSEAVTDTEDFKSLGVASAITFSGKMKGRFILDLSPELAKTIISKMLGEPMDNVRDRLFLSGISELNNTIAGDANTYLNNSYSFSLRLAPPIVFSGTGIMIASSRIESVTILCDTEAGQMKLNLAMQGGAF